MTSVFFTAFIIFVDIKKGPEFWKNIAPKIILVAEYFSFLFVPIINFIWTLTVMLTKYD